MLLKYVYCTLTKLCIFPMSDCSAKRKKEDIIIN